VCICGDLFDDINVFESQLSLELVASFCNFMTTDNALTTVDTRLRLIDAALDVLLYQSTWAIHSIDGCVDRCFEF
jgi:hypothetical protein